MLLLPHSINTHQCTYSGAIKFFPKMTDKEDNGLSEPSTMAEPENPPHHQEPQLEAKKPDKINVAFSIWPPTQRTRDAVINRLIETLTTPSVLAKRYGTMPADEASATARLVEEEAYAAAGGSPNADDEGIEILQVYSREISKRMLEAVKTRAGSGSTADDAPQSPVAASVAASTISEEISSVKTESV